MARKTVVLYGIPTGEAIKKGDLEEMKALLAGGEAWLAQVAEVEASVKKLKAEIKKRSKPAT
ncbi:MAG TPA: DUF1843 domain-containing protein [Nevskia sp.]|nr:DUF1843 domain-containing protein [Nevskia sp.]